MKMFKKAWRDLPESRREIETEQSQKAI